MSVFATHSRPPSSLTRIAALTGLIVALGYGMSLRLPGREATIAEPLASLVGEASATIFPSPEEVAWEGVIVRTLAGGEGLEVSSPAVPGGIFFAYFASGASASAVEGLVRIQGSWRGTTCEYGRCAPEVAIRELTTLAPELE